MIKEFLNAEYGSLRATLYNNTPYFCLVDIAKLLDIKNFQAIRAKIGSSSIETIKVKTKDKTTSKLFIAANHITTCVFSSKKVEAEQINDWIYRTVLPQLIKYGDYYVDDLNDPDKAVKFLDEYQELLIENKILKTDKLLNAPKLKYLNKLLGTNNCIDLDIIHDVIKIKGITATQIFKILRARHIIDEANQPYQHYCDKLYFRAVQATAIAKGTVITSYRTYVYKAGITFIEKIINQHEVTKNAQKNRKPLYP